MSPDNLADRLCEASAAGSPTCVGLDPIPELVSGLDYFDISTSATLKQSLVIFGRAVIDACRDVIAVIKPQSAHYEVWGLDGLEALRETVEYGRSNGVIMLLDAKRGDIASTAASYASAYLRQAPRASVRSIHVDAMTVNPFLGRETIDPFIDAISDGKRGIFVCTRTSNPGAGDIQDARVSTGGVTETVTEFVASWLERFSDRVADDAIGKYGYGPVGAVMGATYPDEALSLRRKLPSSIFLVPGMGRQGGDPQTLNKFFDDGGLGAIASASRSITFEGVDSSSASSYVSSVRENAVAFADSVKRQVIG